MRVHVPETGNEEHEQPSGQAPPQIDRVRPSAMKMMRLSDLRPASDPASIAVARRKRRWIASFSKGSVAIHVTAMAPPTGRLSPSGNRSAAKEIDNGVNNAGERVRLQHCQVARDEVGLAVKSLPGRA